MNFELRDGTAVLARTPHALRALLAGLPAAWTTPNEGPETWSVFDILGHLGHGERTDWIPRARMILARGDDRRFAPFDRFAQARESEGKSLDTLLEEFETLRTENLATLESWRLGEAELELEGEHPDFGRVTLRQLLATWVAHDLGHLAQIGRVMAKQYRDAVGPWRAYLPILERETQVTARRSADHGDLPRSGDVVPHLANVAFLVREYDEALLYFTESLGFRVLEDSPLTPDKRWVRVAPRGSHEAALLLARAATPEQSAAIGKQGGGRVVFFLATDDFDRDYLAMRARGVQFIETPRDEPYGRVAVFEDLYGNRWDLVQHR